MSFAGMIDQRVRRINFKFKSQISTVHARMKNSFTRWKKKRRVKHLPKYHHYHNTPGSPRKKKKKITKHQEN